jgi:hypothetical protein
MAIMELRRLEVLRCVSRRFEVLLFIGAEVCPMAAELASPGAGMRRPVAWSACPAWLRGLS